MKKLINKKHESGENGIAILFSLIMLMIFFIIAFGFISMASTARDAALARAPAATASLSANESVFNEVFVAMETELISNGIVDASKLTNYTFTDGTDSIDVKMWGTRGATADISTHVFLQTLTTGDYYAGGGGTFGWITTDLDGDSASDDRYAWMVIESNGIDPNYIGGKSGGVVTGVRNGEYVRELDIGVIDPTFRDGAANSVYVDWSVDPPAPWEDKKSLVNSLGAAVVESAIKLFEPNTSPVFIGEIPSSRYDLSSNPSGSLSDFINDISWLSSSGNSAKNQVSANLKDFLDNDTEATSELGVVGNERVPYLNEVKFTVTNNTVPPNPASADPAEHETPTEIEISMETPEIISMYSLTSWSVDGSPTGSIGRIVVSGTVKAERTDAVLEEAFSFTFDTVQLDGAVANGYHQPNVISAPVPQSKASTAESAEPSQIEVTIKVESISLYGEPGYLWDQATLDASSDMTNTATIVSQGDDDEVSFEAINPRDNYRNWRWNAWGTDSLGSQNNFFSAPSDENESGNPWEWTTAYMPPGGKISNLTELGMCARTGGKTLNLVDYNADSPTSLGDYKPSGYLTMGNSSSFNGGDRSLLDYVYISNPGTKSPTAGGKPEYKQYGAINPNTSNTEIIKMLLKGIAPTAGPDSGTAPSDATLQSLANRFPGVEASATLSQYFLFGQFNDGNNNHNRNPTMYGYPFSDQHSATPVANLSDPQKEALVVNSMKLVSPKYSYFTILIAADIDSNNTSVSKIRLFVRRDNESGSYKIMKKSEL